MYGSTVSPAEKHGQNVCTRKPFFPSDRFLPIPIPNIGCGSSFCFLSYQDKKETKHSLRSRATHNYYYVSLVSNLVSNSLRPSAVSDMQHLATSISSEGQTSRRALLRFGAGFSVSLSTSGDERWNWARQKHSQQALFSPRCLPLTPDRRSRDTLPNT